MTHGEHVEFVIVFIYDGYDVLCIFKKLWCEIGD